MLILGCGNEDRSDDAAGLLVARKLRSMGLEAREHTGDALGLIEAWNHRHEVTIIDTVVSGTPHGEIVRWDACADRLPPCDFRCSSHDLGVTEAVELARVLGRLPPKLTIYGIEGKRFDLGGTPSPEVIAAAERLAILIAQEQRVLGGHGREQREGPEQAHDQKVFVGF